MALEDWRPLSGQFDEIMQALAEWLLRHLDKVELLLRCIKYNARLHPTFAHMIRQRLAELPENVKEDDKDLSGASKGESSDPIPCFAMRTLWNVFLSGHVRGNSVPSARRKLDDWIDDFKREGLTPISRMELCNLLRLRIKMHEPFGSFLGQHFQPNDPPSISDLVDTDLEPTASDVELILTELKNDLDWKNALPELLDDFSSLLRDGMDLLRMLNRADDKSDLSYTARPSISDNEQNSDLYDWTLLIILTRDAWVAMANQSPDHARRVAEGWFHTPYPLFKRLAFFAAAQDALIPDHQGLESILADEEVWLWSVETQRETLRLLVVLIPRIDAAGLTTLQSAVLKGPPRRMFKDDLEASDWKRIVDREVWLRLTKIQNAGVTLNKQAYCRLRELATQYPHWTLSSDEREEFPVWSDGSQYLRVPTLAVVPHNPDDLVASLHAQSKLEDQEMLNDNWRTYCQNRPIEAATALVTVSQDSIWPALRWRQAFHAWSQDDSPEMTWAHVYPILPDMPDTTFNKVASGLSDWLRVLSGDCIQNNSENTNENDIYLSLCDRILEIELEEDEENMDPVNRAINHPIGSITDVLVQRWYRTQPRSNTGLTNEARHRFTRLCTPNLCKARHGRVVLARHVNALLQVDSKWTREYLLPHFNWNHSEDAAGMWQAFLPAPHFNPSLMTALKPDVLATAENYAQLGRQQNSYVRFLTFAALDLNSGNIFSKPELKRAFAALPPEALATAADALFHALRDSRDQSDNYWNHRVTPFLRNIWPQTKGNIPSAIRDRIAGSFALACTATRDTFPDALDQVKAWLRPLSWEADEVVKHLQTPSPELGKSHPVEVLRLLDTIIGEHSPTPEKLRECLADIESTNSDLTSDSRFQRLQARVT